MQTLFLTIPFPPSINSYWGFYGHRRFLTKKAVQFKADVAEQVRLADVNFGDARLFITVLLYPKDKRIRDLDNFLKSCMDALVQAGLFDDDSQIDRLLVERREKFKGGKAELIISINILK
jgi:crossover junction endodeoxyribonuclease RusA